MLIWPVAHCDLASFLGDLDYLGDSIKQLTSTTKSSEDDVRSVVEDLEPLVFSRARSCDQDNSIEYLSMLYQSLLEATGTTLNDLTGNLEGLELAESPSNNSPTSSFHYSTAQVPSNIIFLHYHNSLETWSLCHHYPSGSAFIQTSRIAVRWSYSVSL